MKKISAIILCFILTVGAMFTLVACDKANVPQGFTTVDFVYTGDTQILPVYKAMVEEYNKTQGQTDKIYVRSAFVSAAGQDGQYNNTLSSSNGPDVFVVGDEYFKKHTYNMQDLTDLFDDSLITDLYDNHITRYHYNRQTNTNNDDDTLYGLPVYNDSTVLYYNKTALEAAGVVCISVAEKDLEAFNNGAKDSNGKTKSDYGIADVTVPAKGFYRSVFNFVPAEGELNGSSWKKKAYGEIMIFNDQIACSWDEIEDVGLLMTKTRNSTSTTEYGYYTEWWFNYGWSVGGDCMVDLTGNGDYVFQLCDDTPNYIVNEGHTYTGLYSGTVYQAGETLAVVDVISANKGDTIFYDTDEKTYYNYTVNGAAAEIRDDVTAKAESGVLSELPSTQEAFKRFCYLSGSNKAGSTGLKVCPSPSAFNATTSVQYFTSNKLALLVEELSQFEYIDENGKFEWGFAPLPIYKEYTDPVDPNCDTVAVKGKVANHSLGYSVCIRKGTQVLDAAVSFINWLMDRGQEIFVENGYVSVRKSDVALMEEKITTKNFRVVIDLLGTAKAGDWWYMYDRTWIDYWASPLNNQVRYGLMTFDDFIYAYIKNTNKALNNYKK